jgi:hypothetical protein
MKCKSGQHEWESPVNAARCCNPDWKRVSVPESEAKALDVNGRIYEEDSMQVSGWIATFRDGPRGPSARPSISFSGRLFDFTRKDSE